MPSLTLTVSYFIKMIFSLIFYAYLRGIGILRPIGQLALLNFLLSDTKVKTDQMRLFYVCPSKSCTFRRHYILLSSAFHLFALKCTSCQNVNRNRHDLIRYCSQIYIFCNNLIAIGPYAHLIAFLFLTFNYLE